MYCRCTDCIHGSGRLTETEDDDDDSDYVACKWFSSIEFFEVQWKSCCKNEESVGRGTSANVEWALKPRQLVNWIARRRPLGDREKCSAAEDIDCLVWVTVGENFSYLYIELERLENPTDWRSNHSHSEPKAGNDVSVVSFSFRNNQMMAVTDDITFLISVLKQFRRLSESLGYVLISWGTRLGIQPQRKCLLRVCQF